MPHPDGLARHLSDALHAGGADQREAALAAAYRALAVRQNAAGLAAAVDVGTGDHHSRPAQVLRADRSAAALQATVVDPGLRAAGDRLDRPVRRLDRRPGRAVVVPPAVRAVRRALTLLTIGEWLGDPPRGPATRR